MSTVDVVIPTYNYGRFLEKCVASVLTQRDVTVRVLIIDDCSSDGTEAVGQQIEASDPRVTYRRHVKNQGHIATFNEGIMDWCSADYSVLLSADDLLTPGSLARAAQLMDHHPEVGLVCGMAVIILDGQPLVDSADVRDPDYRIISGPKLVQKFCEIGNPFPSPVVAVRTSTQKVVGPYSSDMHHTSDMEMWMRFAAHGPVAVMRAEQAYYRWHGDNMSSRYYSKTTSDRSQLLDTCNKMLARHRKELPGLEQWVPEMKSRIAREMLRMSSEAFLTDDCKSWRELYDFALSCDERVSHTADGYKLQLKRLIGQRC